jgi:hypothetical protein
MPIISGASSSGGGALTKVFSQTLVAQAATLDTGANGIAQSGVHLLAIIRMRSTEAATRNSQALTINGDTGANYAALSVRALSTAAAGSAQSSASNIGLDAPAASATTSALGAAWLLIPYYADTTQTKSLYIGSGSIPQFSASTNNWIEARQGFWNSSAAINQLTLTASGAGNFIVGSGWSIYTFS